MNVRICTPETRTAKLRPTCRSRVSANWSVPIGFSSGLLTPGAGVLLMKSGPFGSSFTSPGSYSRLPLRSRHRYVDVTEANGLVIWFSSMNRCL